MPLPKDLDPYANPRAFYGAELRRLREAAGLSQNELGERAFCSGAYIGLFEAAERRPQVDISRALDELLGSGEHLQRLCRFARPSKVAGYFADAAELQLQASSIGSFNSMLVLGLLQTESYARAPTRSAHPFAAEEVIEGHVRTRMERTSLLDSPTAPVLWPPITKPPCSCRWPERCDRRAAHTLQNRPRPGPAHHPGAPVLRRGASPSSIPR